MSEQILPQSQPNSNTPRELIQKLLDNIGIEVITQSPDLTFALFMLYVKAGVITVGEITTMLREGMAMPEFEAIARDAWEKGRMEGER